MISTQQLADVRWSIEHGARRIEAAVRDLPPAMLNASEGDGTWSPFQVVGHLLQAERVNWIPRLRLALEGGDFVPFDRDVHLTLFANERIDDLLTEFVQTRQRNVVVLDALDITMDKLQRTGNHPEFGPVTVGQLLSTWALHDWAHLVQIARTVSKSLGPLVGPWEKYFSVLRR